MGLTLGQLVSGAGKVGTAWRQEEDAQRKSQENQLKIEEQNRLNRFRQDELQAQLPEELPLNIQQYGQQVGMESVPVAPTAAAPAANVPVAPVIPNAGNQVPGQRAMEVWDTQNPMSVVSGAQPAMPSPQQLRAGLAPSNIMTEAAKKPQGGAINANDLANLAYLNNAKPTKPTPVKTTTDSLPTPVAQNPRRNYTKVDATPAAANANIATNPEVQNYFKALEQQNGIPEGVLAAIMQQESGGKAGLTSKAGAQGYFQFMPETAKQYGVTVNDLGSEAQGAAKLVGDLYRKYNGDMTKVLAAYNWGQGNVDRDGIDKAPKETKKYIPEVLARMGKADTTQVPPTIVPEISAKVGDVATPKEQKKISDFYLTNPNAISEDMARAMRQRNEMVRLAKSYQNAGMGLEYTGARAKIMEMDESMFYLQGMQGLNDLAFANDPRRLAAVWSRAKGQPIGIQPRSDGTYNVFVNGNKLPDPYTVDDVSKAARSTFDTAYVKQVNDLVISNNTEAYKTSLKIAEENGKQLAQMIREIALENVKGVNTLNVEKLKGMNYDVKPTGRGDGSVIVTPPFGGTPYFYNPEGKTVEIDGVKITSNAAYPIAGLPSLSGIPQIAKR
jgi:soluble lytic murein transglycosylase-like protein